MPSSDIYSKAQLKEIELLFKDDSYYADLYNSCYSGAPKKVRQEAIRIKNEILMVVEQGLNSEEKKVELPQLSKLLQEYRSSAYATTSSLDTQAKKEENLQQATTILLDIIDSFAKQFKFESPTDFASTLVNLAKPEDKKHFENLQVYRALAKRKLALLNGQEYTYPKKDEDLLVKSFKLKSLNDLYALDKKFTLEEIYQNLDTAYANVCEIPFVKTTFKTNHLKSAGVHPKNIMLGLAAALGVSVLFSFTPIAGAPTVNPSTQAIIDFWVGQMLPIAGIGLATGGAVSTLSAIFDNRTMQHLRNQIRQLNPNQKEILFQLVQKYTPNKENKLTPRQALQKLTEELERNNIKLNWGFRKTAKFNHLVDSERDISTKLSKTLPGATKRQQRKKDKCDSRTFEEHNVEVRALGNDRISKILSPRNPACEHIKIAGTKSRKSSTSPKPEETDHSLNYRPTIVYAREEEPTQTRDLEAEEQLKLTLKRSSLRVKTIKFEFEEAKLAYDVTIKKAEAKSYNALFKRIMEDINDHVRSGDESAIELTYEEGIELGKLKKKTVDVTITPRKKD